MAVRVGINGFGRIGRLVYRVLWSRGSEFEVVLVNDLTEPSMLATLLKYDSTHGRFPGSVQPEGRDLIVDGKPIRITSHRDPAEIPWGEVGVDVVLESTGIFTTREELEKHLAGGAPRVMLSAPAKTAGAVDATLVLGVNDDIVTPAMKLFSNASCTTNCLAPMAKVLNEKFSIEKGLMTTVHAFTNDQKVLDLLHKDPRRARGAGQNIIPTTTGAAKAVGLVIPELHGKLTGMALRVPVPDGSVTDLVVTLGKQTTAEEINAAMKEASEGKFQGIMEYNTDPIVSSDIIGNPYSCIFDASWTTVIDGNLAKVIGWYDNEWGYSNRSADMLELIGRMKAEG